jgi:hypothetical protein
MIQNLFTVNAFIKDYDKSEAWSQELTLAAQAIFQNHLAQGDKTYETLGDDEIAFFTQENINQFPILKELQELFVDGFYELAQSYDNNQLTRDEVASMVANNSGKLPFMKKNQYKRVHNHVGACAFGIFYLSDVDNEREGGELILKDPAFHSNYQFHTATEFPVATKKNRLVVVPGYIWHEVSPYLGNEERLAVVINLDPIAYSKILKTGY